MYVAVVEPHKILRIGDVEISVAPSLNHRGQFRVVVDAPRSVEIERTGREHTKEIPRRVRVVNDA